MATQPPPHPTDGLREQRTARVLLEAVASDVDLSEAPEALEARLEHTYGVLLAVGEEVPEADLRFVGRWALSLAEIRCARVRTRAERARGPEAARWRALRALAQRDKARATSWLRAPDLGAPPDPRSVRAELLALAHEVLLARRRLEGPAGFNELGIPRAKRWRAAGLGPGPAGRWLSWGFGPAQSAAWRHAGLPAPEVAARWRNASFDAADAGEWRALGFDLDNAREWRRPGFDPELAAELRAAQPGCDPSATLEGRMLSWLRNRLSPPPVPGDELDAVAKATERVVACRRRSGALEQVILGLRLLADLYARQGQRSAALAVLDGMPGSQRCARAGLLLSGDDPKAAQSVISHLDSEEGPEAALLRARALERLGQPQSALAWLRKAEALAAAHQEIEVLTRARLRRGLMMRDSAPGAAHELLRQVLEQAPEGLEPALFAEARLSVGEFLVMRRGGDLDEAVEHLQLALSQLEPEARERRARAHLLLGRAMQKMGGSNRGEALQAAVAHFRAAKRLLTPGEEGWSEAVAPPRYELS